MTSTTVHGVLLAVANHGVLLTGPSGIGKSELALELIDRGHALVADDAPRFERTPGGGLTGHCPDLLAELLTVRGLGVLNIKRLYGEIAVASSTGLDLIIDLTDSPLAADPSAGTVAGEVWAQRTLLGTVVPALKMQANRVRQPALWVECAVREQVFRAAGVSSADELDQRLQRRIRGPIECA